MSENTKVIGGRTVVVGKLPPTKAVAVQVALVNLCGEALFKAVTSSKGDQEAAGAAALSALSANLDSTVLLGVMDTVLISYVTIDGERVSTIDGAFAQNVEDLWPTLFFALKVNFQSFFRGSLFNSIEKKMQAALNPSNPQTSTGTSPGQ